jgi:N-acetylmuramoyl-L-alanine amidase
MYNTLVTFEEPAGVRKPMSVRRVSALIQGRREVCVSDHYNFATSNAATGASIQYLLTGAGSQSTTCVI